GSVKSYSRVGLADYVAYIAGHSRPRRRKPAGARHTSRDRARVQEGWFLHGRVYQSLRAIRSEIRPRHDPPALAVLPKRATRAMASSRVAWLSGGIGMLAIHDILQRFHGVTKSGKEYRARCPAHNDQHPSLCIREGDQAILFKCESRGCAVADIIGAASPPLTWHDILPEPHGNGATSRTLIYTATFCDEHGRPLYESLRYHPKAFSLRAAD